MESLLYLKIPSCAINAYINAYIDIILLNYDSRKERVLDIIFLITSNSLASVSLRFVGSRLC
jgi:hypothetical protein